MSRESVNNKKKRMVEIISLLKKEYPDSKCSLNYNSPFQLLVSTILSAQCTDARVNRVTEKLFKKYPGPRDYYTLPLEIIKKEIFSTGFYNNKAKSIKGMAISIVDNYSGELPDNLVDMITLPGVGRKTANVVLGNVYNIPSLVVDTHVTRLSNLLEFVQGRDAVKIEKELMKFVDKRDWTLFAHLIIDHGRAICIANRPKCSRCIISIYCPSCTEKNIN